MTHRLRDEFRHGPGEGTHLWKVLLAPTIWALHFLVVYPGVAVYCAKAGRDAALDPARAAVLAASTVALGFLVWLFLGSWRRRRPSATDADFSFEGNTPEERHRFLTHMSLASSALSIVAVIYTTIPILVLETCR